MTLETWLAFFVACWVISLSPGAGAVASMSAGLRYGFLRGYWNALGLQLALLMQIAVVAAGLGAVPLGAAPTARAPPAGGPAAASRDDQGLVVGDCAQQDCRAASAATG